MNNLDKDNRKIYALDELVLSFKDVCIYGRDLRLFEEDGEWLNDTCINFQLKRLEEGLSTSSTLNSNNSCNIKNNNESLAVTTSTDGSSSVSLNNNTGPRKQQQVNNSHATFPATSDSQHLPHSEGILDDSYKNGEDALLMDPAVVSFFMHQCDDDDEFSDFAAGYNDFRLPIQRVFIPINDTMKPSSNWTTPGLGTHWSLLLMIIEHTQEGQTNSIGNSPTERIYLEDDGGHRDNPGAELETSASASVDLHFYHYDSVPGMNYSTACSVAWKWSLLLLLRLGSRESKSKAAQLASGNNTVYVKECIVPQQKNGYDCGIHVLMTIEALLLHFIKKKKICAQQQIENNENIDNYNHLHNTLSERGITEYDNVDMILRQQMQKNPNFCRELRYRISTDIRSLAMLYQTSSCNKSSEETASGEKTKISTTTPSTSLSTTQSVTDEIGYLTDNSFLSDDL